MSRFESQLQPLMTCLLHEFWGRIVIKALWVNEPVRLYEAGHNKVW